MEAHSNNNAVAATPGPLDFIQTDQIIRVIMRRDVEHQWLMRDAVGLMLSLPALRHHHEQLQRAREARASDMIARLIQGRMLDDQRTDRALLRLQVLTQLFFWVPSALLAAPDRDPAESLDVHARSALALFAVYSTPVGRRQLTTLLDPCRPSPEPRQAASSTHRPPRSSS